MSSSDSSGTLEKGVFTLSLDFELIWGTLDLFGPQGFAEACRIERAHVIDRLLALFEEFEIPATWCIVGHLFLESCSCANGQKHPELVRAHHAWHPSDWFQHDPCSEETSAPNFYGRALVEKIQNCSFQQEIGSHSFSHVIFGDAGCSRETAQSELLECNRVAEEMGISMRSFAFPRNEVGHLDVLQKHGFTCYRGPEPNWYEDKPWPGAAKRLAHLWDVLSAATPPVVLPQSTPEGLINIPGSMIYFPMHGLRRHIPVSRRVRRAVRGMEAAAAQKRIFHLWFHPTNMADEMEKMFGGLRQILRRAAILRERGQLVMLPMGSVADAA